MDNRNKGGVSMAKAIISRRNKKSGVDVIENNGRFWEKSYSGYYWSMPIKANGVWALRSTEKAFYTQSMA